MDSVRCPLCPVCGGRPLYLAPGLAQTWCINDECNVLMWDPWAPALENLRNLGEPVDIRLPDEPPAAT